MGCSSSITAAISTKEEAGSHFYDHYVLGKKLGEGAFGQVRVAKTRQGNQELAVKIIDARARNFNGEPIKECDRDIVRVTKGEIKSWETVGSDPHCVALVAHFFDKNLFYMVMEKCSASLMDRLASVTTMTEDEVTRMFREMLASIAHVHEVDIVHRDIKPDNFLLGGPDGATVKLCDFGLAAKMPTTGLLKGVYGTAPYMSPEMLQGNGYGKVTDVWSFGASAFLMIHGDFPYSPPHPTAATMKKAIATGKPDIQWIRPAGEDVLFSKAFVDRATPFLQSLLQRSPQTRLSAADGLKLPLFCGDQRAASKTTVMLSNTDLPPLEKAVRKARKATQALKNRPAGAHPIVQRTLDDLLEKLQDDRNRAMLFFSETRVIMEEQQEKSPSQAPPSDERIPRQPGRSAGRHLTHSGVVSDSLSSFAGSSSLSPVRPRGSSDATPTTVGTASPMSPAVTTPTFSPLPPARRA